MYADRDRALPVVEPEDRELVMSCGAALAHHTVTVRHFGYGRSQPGEEGRTPHPDLTALMVLSTAGVTPSDWLTAGQAVAAPLSRTAAHGLAASFPNQPIRVPALRVRLRDLLGGSDSPQLLPHIRNAAIDRPTPRRTVADVLTDAPTNTGTSS